MNGFIRFLKSLSDPKGYIRFHYSEDGTAINSKARIGLHRIMYLRCKGEVPKGLIVRHKCDVPSCCNPDHLELGTDADNMEDRKKRGRTAIGERASKAKLKEAQVREIKALKGTGKSATTVGAMFGIKRSAVYGIWNGLYWKHLT